MYFVTRLIKSCVAAAESNLFSEDILCVGADGD